MADKYNYDTALELLKDAYNANVKVTYKDLENAEYYDDSTADQVLLEVDDALVEDDGISDSDVDNLF